MWIKHDHIAGARKGVAIFAVLMVVSLGSLTGASSVLASPKGIFAVYEQCPTSIPVVRLCQHAELTSGEVAIGPMRVPIYNPIVLQGGAIPTGSANFNEYFGAPAVNGENLTKANQDVPGGLSTLLDCAEIKGGSGGHDRWSYRFQRRLCRALVRHGRRDLSVIVESAASPTNPVIENFAALIEETGTSLVFPIKLHLQSPVLGEACYIGSETNPLELHLTDGTTNPPAPALPIKGKAGTPASEIENGYESLTTTEDTLVDNDFPVPAAEGCGADPYLASLINPLINQTLGLPSAPGQSAVILSGVHKNAETEAVLASEAFPTNPTPPPPPPRHPHHHWWTED